MKKKWRRFFKKFRLRITWAGSSDTENDPKGETSQEKELRKGAEELRQQLEELRRRLEEFKTQTTLNVDADNLTNVIDNYQLYETILFNERGFFDGKNGTKDRNIDSIARIRAGFIQEHSSSILRGKIRGLQTQLALKVEQIMRVLGRLADERKFNDKINALHKSEHRHFSLPTAIFYLVFAVAMLAADFPISLGISGYFVKLPSGFKFTFFNEIKAPEILLFSLGISCLGVYFKILYDNYINDSIIRDEVKQVQKPWHIVCIQVLVSLAILAALLVLLYHIGIIRSALNPMHIPAPSGVVCLVGMTILLPLLAGICFSSGLGIMSNRTNLKKSEKRFAALGREQQALEDEKTRMETVKSMLEELYGDWKEKEEKIEGLTGLFANAYYQSYKRWHRVKFGYDLYKTAQALFVDEINSKN